MCFFQRGWNHQPGYFLGTKGIDPTPRISRRVWRINLKTPWINTRWNQSVCLLIPKPSFYRARSYPCRSSRSQANLQCSSHLQWPSLHIIIIVIFIITHVMWFFPAVNVGFSAVFCFIQFSDVSSHFCGACVGSFPSQGATQVYPP
jgi:hypothetical protein